MHEGLSLSRNSFVWLTNGPDMTIDVNCGRKTPTHTNTLFPWGKSTIQYLSLHGRFPLPWYTAIGQIRQNLLLVSCSPAVSKGILGRQQPKVACFSGKLVAPVNGPLAGMQVGKRLVPCLRWHLWSVDGSLTNQQTMHYLTKIYFI